MVESIHMKQRMSGIPFSIKNRNAKDKYIESNFRNILTELSSDVVNYGTDIVLRKLLHTYLYMHSIALEIAQNIGTDYHAANEELYYYMRKNDQKSHENIIAFIDGFYKRINKKDQK
jgi:predicted lipase